MSPRNNNPFTFSRFISNYYDDGDDDGDEYVDIHNITTPRENTNTDHFLSGYDFEVLERVLGIFYANNAPGFPHVDYESDSDMSMEDDSFYDDIPSLEYNFLGDVPPLEFTE